MFYMIPIHVFLHKLFVKLCIVILDLLGLTGSITFLWTSFFYLLWPFTPLLGSSEGVKGVNLCLGMSEITSLLCWTKDDTNMQATPSLV